MIKAIIGLVGLGIYTDSLIDSLNSLTMQGIDALLEDIDKALYPSDVTMMCLVPYAQMALIDRSKKTLDIRILESTEEGIRLQASGTKEHMKVFEPYRTGENR